VARLDLDRLEALGFFRHVPAADLDRVRREMKASGWPFATHVHRNYRADAEDLAEGDVLNFLGVVAPFLRREGVPIAVEYREVKVPATKTRPAGRGVATLTADGWINEEGAAPRVGRMRVSFAPGRPSQDLTQDYGEERYTLISGDREIRVWSADDDAANTWQRATRVTLAVLNELLSAHGSAERAFALHYGGEELTVVFATPEMARVRNAGINAPRDRLHDEAGDLVS
jgi:hypothetical protein